MAFALSNPERCRHAFEQLWNAEHKALRSAEQTILNQVPLNFERPDWSACLQGWNKAALQLPVPENDTARIPQETAKCASLGFLAEMCEEHVQAVLRMAEALRWQEAAYVTRPFPERLPWAAAMGVLMNAWFVNLAACSRKGNPDYQKPLNDALGLVGSEIEGEHPTLAWFRRKDWDVFDTMDRCMAFFLTAGDAQEHTGVFFRFFRDLLTSHAVYSPFAEVEPRYWEQQSDITLGYVVNWNYVLKRQLAAVDLLLAWTEDASSLPPTAEIEPPASISELASRALQYHKAIPTFYEQIMAPDMEAPDLAPSLWTLRNALSGLANLGEARSTHQT
ncbi:MAG: hypothetical protein ACLFU6_04865 [Candidatus Hydrogenedentota bacterium]